MGFKMNKNNVLSPISKKNLNYRSQDLDKTYYDTGTFGIFSSEVFYKRKKLDIVAIIFLDTKE